MTNEARTPGTRRYDFDTHFMELTRDGDVFWVAKVNAPNRPIKECAELGCEIADKLNAHDGLVAENERLKELVKMQVGEKLKYRRQLGEYAELCVSDVEQKKTITALVEALKDVINAVATEGAPYTIDYILNNQPEDKHIGIAPSLLANLLIALRQAGETVEGT